MALHHVVGCHCCLFEEQGEWIGFPGCFDSVGQWCVQDSVSFRLVALHSSLRQGALDFFQIPSEDTPSEEQGCFSPRSLGKALPAPRWTTLANRPSAISELVTEARKWGAWLELEWYHHFRSKQSVRGRCGYLHENWSFWPREASVRWGSAHRLPFRLDEFPFWFWHFVILIKVGKLYNAFFASVYLFSHIHWAPSRCWGELVIFTL